MKTSYMLAIILLAGSCNNDDIGPLNKIDINIGQPFTVSAPAEITITETGEPLLIESLTDYWDSGFLPPTTTAKILYKGKWFELTQSIFCSSSCPGKELILQDGYLLVFEKVTASSIKKDHEAGADIYRVDSARFVLQSN